MRQLACIWLLLAVSVWANEWVQENGVRRQLTNEEQAALDASRASSFGNRKAARLQAVKARTIELVETGTFAYGGKAFALDAQTRSNWVGAIAAVNAGLMQYPRQVTAVDGTRLTISNDAEARAFYAAGVAAVAAIEESAYALVDAILAATNDAELQAVEDDR